MSVIGTWEFDDKESAKKAEQEISSEFNSTVVNWNGDKKVEIKDNCDDPVEAYLICQNLDGKPI